MCGQIYLWVCYSSFVTEAKLTTQTSSVFFLTCTLNKVWDTYTRYHMDRVKRIWYLSPMRAAKVQASLRIRAVSPEPSLLAHSSSESSGTFRQKARSLAPLNGWACAVKICHDGMLEDTNSLDAAHIQGCPFITLLLITLFWIHSSHSLAPKWLFYFGLFNPLYNTTHL